MSADAKECAQCGWDVSLNAPPTTDPGDTKARLGVAAGIVVAYVVMSTLISGTPAPEVASTSDASTSPEALIIIKAADTKKTTIPARDALQYVFGLPDTDQK